MSVEQGDVLHVGPEDDLDDPIHRLASQAFPNLRVEHVGRLGDVQKMAQEGEVPRIILFDPDINQGEQSGIEVLQGVREAFPNTPVVVCTTQPQGEAEKYLIEGVKRVILLPTDVMKWDELIVSLRQIVNERND